MPKKSYATGQLKILMGSEIERKFFVKDMPDVSELTKTSLERHFLYNAGGIELRIQTDGTRFTLQRKTSVSDTERATEQIELSRSEFDTLKTLAPTSISRDSYHLADNPKTDLRLYHGAFEGLVRAEFEFERPEELASFQPPDWVGKEMTGSPLSRDSWLIKLNPVEFSALL